MLCINIPGIEPDIVHKNDSSKSLKAFLQTRFLHSDDYYRFAIKLSGLEWPRTYGLAKRGKTRTWSRKGVSNVSVLSFRSKTISGKNKHTYTDATRSGVVCGSVRRRTPHPPDGRACESVGGARVSPTSNYRRLCQDPVAVTSAIHIVFPGHDRRRG